MRTPESVPIGLRIAEGDVLQPHRQWRGRGVAGLAREEVARRGTGGPDPAQHGCEDAPCEGTTEHHDEPDRHPHEDLPLQQAEVREALQRRTRARAARERQQERAEAADVRRERLEHHRAHLREHREEGEHRGRDHDAPQRGDREHGAAPAAPSSHLPADHAHVDAGPRGHQAAEAREQEGDRAAGHRGGDRDPGAVVERQHAHGDGPRPGEDHGAGDDHGQHRDRGHQRGRDRGVGELDGPQRPRLGFRHRITLSATAHVGGPTGPSDSERSAGRWTRLRA